MTSGEDRLAEEMAQAELAFTGVVIDRKTVRTVAAELGISPATVSRRVKTYKRFLADDRITEDREQKRGTFEAMANDLYSRAITLFDRVKDSKPLAAVAALNTAVATLPHLRAVQGLDEPKEVKAEVDTDITVRWEE